jgi:hypothetical protein
LVVGADVVAGVAPKMLFAGADVVVGVAPKMLIAGADVVVGVAPKMLLVGPDVAVDEFPKMFIDGWVVGCDDVGLPKRLCKGADVDGVRLKGLLEGVVLKEPLEGGALVLGILKIPPVNPENPDDTGT